MLSKSLIFFYFNLTLIGLVFIIGFKSDSFSKQKLASDLFAYHGQKITFQGRVCEEAEVDYKTRRLIVCLPDKILITTNLYPQYNYGDVLEITGQLEAPPILENFDYQRYLGKSNIYSVMYYPKLKLIKKASINNWSQFLFFPLFKFKQKIKIIFERSLEEPEAGLAKAIFLGEKRQILAADQEAFARTGLSHLIAISGTHLVVLSALIVKLTSFFRFPRRLALLVNSIFLIIYPIFTGLSASAVRAGLMGLLVLLAFYEGRLITSIRAVVFSAALMLIFNPQLLRADLGFQLSYLAVLGIIYLYPLFSAIKKIYPKYLNGFLLTFFKNLTDVLSITLACQITTMPIMLINFKQVSLISPLANILVIWTFPFLFIALIAPLILISLIPGAIFPLLGPWLFAPAYFLLFYIFSLARYLAAFPWAVKIVEDFNWFEAFISYLLLSLIIFLFQRKIKQGSQTKAPP